VWLAFWFWAFSFAYSDGFFRYERCSRLPVFAAALLGAVVIPGSARRAWRRRTLWAALVAHLAGVVCGLAPLALVSALSSRLPGPCRLSADDAMGAGIDFMLLVGVSLLSTVALVGAWALRRRPAGAVEG
jgi:hypothetical protein